MTVRRRFYDPTPPSVPGSPSATPLSETTIRVTWSASADSGTGVQGYKVYRALTAGGTYALIATLGLAVLSYDDATLTANQSRSYKVTAFDLTPNETALASSTAATATTLDVTAPTTPTAFTATPASSSQINLSWTASTDAGAGIARYVVERSPNGSSGWTQVYSGATASFNDTGLSSSTQYFYRVHAEDAATPANSSGFATANATTQAGVIITSDIFDDFESGTNRIVTAANSGYPSGGGGTGIWQPYTGDGALGNTSVIASAARAGGFGLRYQITSGSGAYVDFDPVDNQFWYFAREQMSSGNPWSQNKWNRLGIWVFVPANMPMTTDPNRQGVELGTYVRGKYDPATDNLTNWRVDPEAKGGWHYYHFYTFLTGVWSYFVVDEHPQHSREGGGGRPQGNPGAMNGIGSNIWPTATVGWNYMDALTRIYWNNWRTNGSSFPVNIFFDHLAFFSEPNGDVDNIASLEASWNPSTNLLHLGFCRNPADDPSFEGRWCAQDMNVVGFNAGTQFGTVGADGNGGYVNKKIEGIVPQMASLPGVYVGVRRTGQTPFRQLYLPRVGV